MDLWGTAALTGHSCEDWPSRTTISCLLVKKEEIWPNSWPKIPYDVSLWRRTACQTLSKALDISSAAARVAPDLWKALVVLSKTTVRRSAVDREDLKPYWKSYKGSQFSMWSTILLFTNFSKTLLTTERRITGRWFLAVDIFPAFLNKVTTDETFQQSGKQDSFRHMLKSSASMYESSLEHNQDQTPFFDLFLELWKYYPVSD